MSASVPVRASSESLALHSVAVLAGYFLILWFHLDKLIVARDILTPDAISYLGVAERLARGDFGNAINAYWGPLISWALAMPIMAGLDPVHSFHLLNAVLAWFGVFLVFRFLREFGLAARYCHAIGIGVAVPLISWSIVSPTPDLLFVVMMLVSIWTVWRFAFRPSSGRAMAAGASGALLYLAKGFGLPLFLLSIGAVVVVVLIKTRGKRPAVLGTRNVAAFVAGVGVPSLLWIGTLFWKYGELMYSSAGTQNILAIGPPPRRPTSLQEVAFNGPISFWYDPSNRSQYHWSPIESWESFKYWLGIVEENVVQTWGYLGAPYVIALVVGFGWLARFLRGDGRHSLSCLIVASYILAQLAIQPVLYSLIAVEPRYLWAPMLATFLLVVVLFQRAQRSLVVALCAVGLVVVPPMSWSNSVAYSTPTVFVGADTLPSVSFASYRADGATVHQWICGTHMASNGQVQASMYIAYYGRAAYHGSINLATEDVETVRQEFDAHRVTTFFLWGWDNPDFPEALDGFVPVWTSANGRLTILQANRDPDSHEEWLGGSCIRPPYRRAESPDAGMASAGTPGSASPINRGRGEGVARTGGES